MRRQCIEDVTVPQLAELYAIEHSSILWLRVNKITRCEFVPKRDEQLMPQREDGNRVALTMAALLRAANGPSVFQRIDQRRILNHAAEVIEDLSLIASCVGQRCENDDLVARVRDCALFISVMSSERVIGDLLACAAGIRDLRIKSGLIAIKFSSPDTSASLPTSSE
jgi:hypothetical protein